MRLAEAEGGMLDGQGTQWAVAFGDCIGQRGVRTCAGPCRALQQCRRFRRIATDACEGACTGRYPMQASVVARLMKPRHRTRRRFIDAVRSHRIVALAVALALAMLMSFQIATQTVTRLLWPAHTHVASQAQRDGVGDHSPCRWLNACVHGQGAAATARRPHAAPAMQAQTPGDAGVAAQIALPARVDHLRLWLEHADAHTPLRPTANSSPAEDAFAAEAGPEHSHIQILSHALAHAAGVGYHRHAAGTTGVVYVDDDGPQLPAKLLMRSGDISPMLLPAQLLLPIQDLSSAAPSGPPLLALIARYCLPGERPPR
ncbi:hypothetical protein [Xanthomonas arboricola]|uniref:hypothetical protein n=1 Tax=Xanthomonas arboricola TaxID=56448 RepID=UPI001CA4FD43|nr:hypothetical protein [Xanthomonas arboricola]